MFKKRVPLKLNASLPGKLFYLEKYISNNSAMFVFLPQYLDIQIFVYSLQWINFALRESKGLWKSVFIASNYGVVNY